MAGSIKTRLVRIGNSRGVRIPKLLLDQVALGPDVVLTAERNRLVISRATRPREAWGDQFRHMAERGDDRLLDAEALPHLSQWDTDEWEW
jgi:antitoxin MazE